MSFLSRTEPGPVAGVAPPPSQVPSRAAPEEVSAGPRGRDAARVLAAEALADFRNFATTMTKFAERIQGRIVNHVLGVETCVIDASANPVFRTWHAAAGCVELANFSAAGVVTVVATGNPGGITAPTSGVGVYRVPAGTKRVIALASRQMTVYGAAGDAFSYQAFTAEPTPVI